MSFILDALKKSESDRQRQSSPALFEVKVTPPKPRFPYWAIALAALLVINIGVAAWVFLHRAPPEQAAAIETAAAPPSSVQERALPPAAAPPAVQSVAPPSVTATAAPAAPPVSAAAGASSQPEPVLSDSEPKDAALNPDDYEPAVAPGRQFQDQAGAHARSGTESGFRSYADAAQSPDSRLPALRIDLHVY